MKCTCSETIGTTNELCPACVAEFGCWIADQEEAAAQEHRVYVSHDIGWLNDQTEVAA